MSSIDKTSRKKIAVITGGAGGMGLATAKILGRDHEVIICDVNQQKLAAALDELEQLDIACSSVVCDITDRSSVDDLVTKASLAGEVVAVVHTAGLSPQMADPETIIRVNAIGTINIAEAFLKVATDGFALVNVASMAGYLLPGLLISNRVFRWSLRDPSRFLSKMLFRCKLMPSDFYRRGMAYSLSKRFVMWFSQVKAKEFGAKNARIVSVSPGTFDTEMGQLEEKSGSIEMLKDAALKRAGTPEEIAQLLAFCASNKASYLTGVDILCDGGLVASKTH